MTPNFKRGDIVTNSRGSIFRVIEVTLTNAVLAELEEPVNGIWLTKGCIDHCSISHLNAMYWFWTSSEAKPKVAACEHTFQKYVGFREVYHFCTKCDNKQDSVEDIYSYKIMWGSK
jgi:tRNA U38,U39,U40 pseudouridine synthase TruA